MKNENKNTIEIDRIKEACYQACLAKLARGIWEIQKEKAKKLQGGKD